MRRLWILVMALMIVAILPGADAGTSGSFSTYYNQPPDSKHIDLRVIDVIESANSTLDVAMYSLNRQNVVDALIERHDAGVNVRIVTELDTYNSSTNRDAWLQIEAAGIPVVTDVGTALMHHKFIIADGQRVLTGSYNLTDSQTTEDKNMIVVIESSELAGIFQEEFDQMFEDHLFHGSKRHISGSVMVDGSLIEVYFSPRAGGTAALIDAINTANSNIYFDIFVFTSDDVSQAMLDRYAEGVRVKGSFDRWSADSVYSEYATLLNAGIPVRRDTYPGFLHEKIMAIDAYTSSDPIGVIGSFNWTASADASNDETLLIIHNSFVANSIRGQCVYVYNNHAD